MSFRSDFKCIMCIQSVNEFIVKHVVLTSMRINYANLSLSIQMSQSVMSLSFNESYNEL